MGMLGAGVLGHKVFKSGKGKVKKRDENREREWELRRLKEERAKAEEKKEANATKPESIGETIANATIGKDISQNKMEDKNAMNIKNSEVPHQEKILEGDTNTSPIKKDNPDNLFERLYDDDDGVNKEKKRLYSIMARKI